MISRPLKNTRMNTLYIHLYSFTSWLICLLVTVPLMISISSDKGVCQFHFNKTHYIIYIVFRGLLKAGIPCCLCIILHKKLKIYLENMDKELDILKNTTKLSSSLRLHRHSKRFSNSCRITRISTICYCAFCCLR